MGEKGNPDRDNRTHRESETSLERGLRQAGEGDVVYLGSFAQPDRIDQLLRYASWLGFPLALGIFFADPPVDRILLAAVGVLGAVVVVATTVRAHQSKRRAANVTIDHVVYAAVKRDPGHCATTYAKATNGEHHVVQRSLDCLVKANHLKTSNERFTNDIPSVKVYEPT